jgi:HAD superfamily hydrolase (TIGR01509 family)
MKAIIFDMDGVLVDAMPFHYQAMSTAIKESANIDLDKRTFYLLEGMPVANMALEIFKLKGYANNTKKISKKKIQETAEKVAERKKDLFRKMDVIPKPYDGVRDLIIRDLKDCPKAVVSGAAREEVDIIIEEVFGKDKFNVIIDGDAFEGKGKPDPSPFESALRKLKIEPSEALVVENAPLGVKAANNAAIPCIVTLNTSPLTIADFKGLISEHNIFKNSKSTRGFLKSFFERVEG